MFYFKNLRKIPPEEASQVGAEGDGLRVQYNGTKIKCNTFIKLINVRPGFKKKIIEKSQF